MGGARVVDGKIDTNALGFEPGNQIINFDETKKVSPFHLGTLESYVSGTAFKKLYGVKPELCTDPSIWEMYARHLAAGIANILVLWSPDIVILGGGISRSADKFLTLLRIEVAKNIPFPNIPHIEQSVLGDDAALYGGLVLLTNGLSLTHR